MSDYLQHYVNWGLSQIVFVSSRQKEVESGYNLEITWETVVARKGQSFVEVVAQEQSPLLQVPEVGASGKTRNVR